MSGEALIAWLWRIALGCLGFVIIWFGLPWLLQLVFHVVWPDVVVGILACIGFLIGVSYTWWWRPRGAA